MSSPAGTASAEHAVSLVEEVRTAAAQMGAGELAERLRSEAARWTARETMVVVAGQPAAGKTALINAIVGQELGAEGEAAGVYVVVRKGEGGPQGLLHLDDRAQPELVSLRELRETVRVGEHANGALLRAAEVRVAHPLLDSGLVLVDTPGIGGLDGAHARATMAALSRADALVLVTSAGAPLTEAELGFLAGATSRLATVIVVLTHTDRFRGWRQVAADDRRLLGEHAPRLGKAPIVPVSCRLKREADKRAAAGEPSSSLAVESGVPALVDEIRRQVVDAVHAVRAANMVRVAGAAVHDLRSRVAATLEAARGADDSDALIRERRRQVDEVRDRSERALVMTTDGFAALRDQVTAEFTRAMRDLGERYESEAGSHADPASLCDALLAEVRAIDTNVGVSIDDLADRLTANVMALLTETPEAERRAAATGDGQGDTRPAVAGSGPTDPTMRMRMAATMMSAGTGMTFAARFMLDPSSFVNGLVGAGVVLGVVAAALNLRMLRRQRDFQAVRRQIQATLDFARTEAMGGIRQRIVAIQRGLEADVKSYSRERTRELQEAIAEATELARAETAARAKVAAEAEARMAALDRLAARLSAFSSK